MKKIEMKTLDDLDIVLRVARTIYEAQGPLDIIIKKHSRDLSAEQRALYWMWMGVIGAEIGNTKEEQHQVFKERFLIGIYIRDTVGHPGFAEMAASIKALKYDRPNEYHSIRAQVLRLVSITDASVENMTEYLNEIQAEARSLNIKLPMPETRGIE